MGGFDPGFSGRPKTPAPSYQDRLQAWFDRGRPDLLPEAQRQAIARAFERFPKERKFRRLSVQDRASDRQVFAELLATVSREQSSLVTRYGAAEVEYLKRTLQNILALYDWHAAVGAEQSTDIPFDKKAALNNVRDQWMADNILWFAKERYPSSKIIVWAASFHLGRDIESLSPLNAAEPEPSFVGYRSLGDLVTQALGDAVYTIAFTSAGGQTGIAGAKPQPIGPAPDSSLEAVLSDTPYGYGFIDLRPQRGNPMSWMKSRPAARFLGHTSYRGDWSQAFDGLFYIRTMTPSVGTEPHY